MSASTAVAEKDPLLDGKQAAAFLGGSRMIIASLRKIKILTPELAERAPGRWAYHYRTSHLAKINVCLKTHKSIWEHGYADPVEGQLWVIQKNSQPATDGTLYSIVNLGTEGGRLFSVSGACSIKHISDGNLASAIEHGLPAVRIFGAGNILAVRDRELAKLRLENKPVKVDRKAWKPVSHLLVDVGIDKNDIGMRREASECAKLWVKLGLLPTKTERQQQQGTVPKNWTLNASGSRIITNYQTVDRAPKITLYHAARFKELWDEGIEKHVKLAKQKIGTNGTDAKNLRVEFEKIGVPTKRFRRVIREAGAIIKPGCRPAFYILKHHGPTPLRKHNPPGRAADWLTKKLSQGPVLFSTLLDMGRRAGFVGGVLRRAFRKMGGKRHFPGRKFEEGRPAFWLLPDQEPPTKDEAERLLLEYQNAKRNTKPVVKVTSRPEVAAPAAEQPQAKRTPAFLSAPDLAAHTGHPAPAVESFLRRFRMSHPDCFEKNEMPRRNEPSIMYRCRDVIPALNDHFSRKKKPHVKP